jgi:hypothetical protein
MQISGITPAGSQARLYPIAAFSASGRVEKIDSIDRTLSVIGPKNSVAFQADAALKLMQSNTVIHDPDMGQHIDTYA